MRRYFAVPAACVALLGAQPNSAPVTMSTPPAESSERLGSVDQTFAIAATQGNDAEIDAAHIAIARTSTDGVVAFAKLMLTDHGDMALDGRRAIGAHLTRRPAPFAAADALALHALRQMPAVDVDQNYALLQVADHLATQSAFETEARDGADPALRAFAAKWLPTIGAHLQLAVTLVKHVGGDTPLRR